MKSRKSIRGLSPIFATLILIAIAVIAGIIVYMFTSGTLASMLGGSTTGQEKMAIQAVSGGKGGTGTSGNVTIYAQSTGGGPIALDSVILKDAQGTVLRTYPSTAISPTTVDTVLTTVVVTIAKADVTVGSTYTVTLVSTAGGSFVSSSFKAVA